MKFKDVVKGTRAEIAVEIPKYQVDGKPVITLIRPLVQEEEDQVLSSALKDAIAAGLPSPKKGDELYDAAIMVHTIALACLDPDSPPDNRQPTFGNAAEVRHWYGSDEIGYLYERQETHQGACSPSITKATPEQLMQITEAIARAPDADPFIRLAPALRCLWARIMAKQLIALQEPKSLSGSSSPATE